jgi:hypothetical protein
MGDVRQAGATGVNIVMKTESSGYDAIAGKAGKT